MGPFNLTISCIKVKFFVFNFFNFLGCYTSRAASQNYKIYSIMELAQNDLSFFRYGQNNIICYLFSKKYKKLRSKLKKIVSQIELNPSPVIKFCDAALEV